MPGTRADGLARLGLWLLALGIAPAPVAAEVVEKKWDSNVVRRVEKIHITTELQLLRRAASSTCPTNYSLCPSSLSGGCCPTNYACETDSCVQTTAATTASACGLAGYINCGISAAGGCCPSGYICGVNDCTAPAGASQSQCPTGYYLCPASYNYGCCQTTMGCALNACYATTPSTLVFTATYTTATDAAGKAKVTTVTSTTVETPTAPSGLPSDTSVFLPKYIPATEAKVAEVSATSNSTATDSSSGLSTAQIGGLIGGLVGLLIVILIAAFFIIRSLRKTAKAVKKAERRKRSSGGGSGTGKSSGRQPIDGGGGSGGVRNSKQTMAQAHGPTPSEVNQMEYDDLLESETVEMTQGGPIASTSGIPHGAHLSNIAGAVSPPLPDPLAYGKISSDFSSPSAAADGGLITGYFDLPQRPQNRPGRYSMSTDPRTSMDSQGQQPPSTWQQQYQRPRIISDASERSRADSVGMGPLLQPVELGVDGEIIPELPSVVQEGAVPPTTGVVDTQHQSQAPQRPRPFSNISALSGVSSFSSGAQQQQQLQQQPLMADHSRNWSDGSDGPTGFTPSHSRDRSNSFQQQQQQQQQQPRLDVVAEAVEHLHGHYGPTHVVAGQTRAGADVEIDISSPIAP